MASNPIEVRADEWCPYNCDPKEDRKGYLIDILIKAFGEENINYETMNWARAISETKKGTYNAIIGATKDEGRDFIFSQPLGINQNCFYSNKNVNLKYAGIDSLKSIKLGIVKDYSYYPELNKYIKLNIENKNLIDESYGDFVLQKLVKKIQNHDIDAFVEDQNVVNYYLKINTYIDFLKKFGCHNFEYI